MPDPYLDPTYPQTIPAEEIVPGMTYDLAWEHHGQDDWRLWDFRCHVRPLNEDARAYNTPLLALYSEDNEITVAQTDEEILATGERWQLLTLRISSSQSLLLTELKGYKLDVIGSLKTDPDIRTIVLPLIELRALERVTDVA